MTLKEAYEIKRKENLSLRSQIAKLQNGDLCPMKEKKDLERQIHSLEQVIKNQDERFESAKKYRKGLESERFDLIMKNLELEDQIRGLKKENELLRARAEKAEAEVALLNGTKKELEQKLNTNFENSSLPSSALPFRKKIPNSRKATGRKQGAQPGHKGHSASRLLTTREPVIIPTPDEILMNPDFYATGKKIIKQLIDISVSVNVTDFITDEYRNHTTGRRIHASFPDGMVNEITYGPNVKAFAFLLNNYYNVSIAKTRQCISDITRGVVNLSTGMINRLSKDFSAATKPERMKIFSRLVHSDVLYSDATVSNINGTRKAVILCTDKKDVLYQHFEHKGHEGLKQTPVKDSKGTLVHDHDKSYYAYGSSHQECIAHVLRYLVGSMENEPDLTWHQKMHEFLQSVIHEEKQSPTGVSRRRFYEIKRRYEEILLLAKQEYTEHPPTKYYPDGYNLQKKMSEYEDSHLLFLINRKVDYTNNLCERELRKFKRKQKQAVVLRSDSGAEYICDALTMLESARMQHRNIYDIAEAAFDKTIVEKMF